MGKKKSEDSESDDDAPKRKKSKKESKTPEFEPHERFRKIDPNSEEFNGTPEESVALDQAVDQYSQEDWAGLISKIMGSSVDSDTPDDTLKEYQHLFYRVFCSPLKTEYDVFNRIKSLYPSARGMKDQFHNIQEKFGHLHMACVNKRWLDEETVSGRELKHKFSLIARNVKASFDQLVQTRILQNSHDPMTRAMLEELTPEAFFQEVDMAKIKKHQRLLYFYLGKASRSNYRKDGDAIYQPRYNDQGQFVHAYEYVFDISDFVFDGLFPLDLHHYWFDCLTEKPGNAQFVIKSLTTIKTEWLPNLKRNDMIHAFSNGLFSIEFNHFFHFQPGPGQYSVRHLMNQTKNCTAIKYHDMVFDEEGMQADMDADPEKGYLAIQLPEITKILHEQEFSDEEQRFILAMGGRLLFPLGKFEQWQVFPYFLGLAGTGKSLFLRLVAKCLEKRDVAILSNACQKGFALDGMETKKLFLALDITETFALDQATFQSMVSGEEVSIIRKFKQPLTVVWVIHGGFAGNKLPNWQDNGGSLTRRVIVIEFLKRVTNSDPQLFDKCCMKMDRFLKLVVSAYHELVCNFGTSNIKDCMPDKFRSSEKKALVELNLLAQFLSDTCEIAEFKQGSDNFTTSADLLAVFRDFCQKQSIKQPKFCYTFYNGVFAKNMIKETKNSDGNAIFEGVRLKTACREWLIKRNQ